MAFMFLNREIKKNLMKSFINWYWIKKKKDFFIIRETIIINKS